MIQGPPTPRSRAWAADGYAGGLTTVLVALAGLPVGWIWATLAPRAPAVVTASGVDLANPETKAFVGADAYFLFISAAAGLLCALVAYRLGRRRSIGVLLGLAGGGFAAALIAAAVGHQLTYDALRSSADGARLGAHLLDYVTVRAEPVLVAWPLAAVVAFALLELTLGRPTSGPTPGRSTTVPEAGVPEAGASEAGASTDAGAPPTDPA